jgi:hypothetical protein
MPGSLSLTDHDTIISGMLPSNVYWQIGQAITVVNNDAANRTFPGTAVNKTAASDINITCSGAGNLAIGRQLSIGGGVTVTQSGAGILTVQNPAPAAGGGGPNVCGGADLIFPSPATGPTAQFAYCMALDGDVTIRVYNAIGDLVAKVDDTKPAGSAVSTLNTARLAPGVYLYRIQKNYSDGSKDKPSVKKFVVKR